MPTKTLAINTRIPNIVLSFFHRHLTLFFKAACLLSSFKEAVSLPQHPQVEALQSLVQLYTQEKQKGDVCVTSCSLSSNHPLECTQRLSERLFQLGFLQEKHISPTATPEVLEALHAFQRAHHLKESNTLTDQMLCRFKKPLVYWLQRAQQNLERWNRIQELGEDYLIINIPAFTVHGFKGREEVFSSKVIVGKESSVTPQFSSEIIKIITHPIWYVPPRMASRLEGSAGSKGYCFRGGQLVQKPGHYNALGPIKFVLEGVGNILMHSTNKPSLFEKKQRAYSAGCIRVQSYQPF
jgi:murein L,D-transpeptidase YcbB/YkuD